MTASAIPTPQRRAPDRLPPRLGGGVGVGNALAFWRDPVALLERGWRQCGSLFEFRMAGRIFAVFAGARAHDAFFRAPEDQLSAKEVYRFTVPIFGEGIAYDAAPGRMDEQIAFLFPALRDDRMRSYALLMEEETRLWADRLGERGELDLPEATNEITVNVASRCLLGEEVRKQLDTDFAPLYHDLQAGINAVGFFAPRLPIPPHRRRDRARRAIVALLSSILAERRRSGVRREDFLQTLMETRYRDGGTPSDDEIAGILLTALFAGQHTSAVLSAWVGVELMRHPAYLQRVCREISAQYADGAPVSFSSLKEQEVLDRAVRECERLHPPLILLVRSVERDFHWEGIRVPAGRLAMVSPGLSHRLPSVFSDPLRFDPDRFAEPRNEARDPYTLIGFGGGKHRCIGLHFAYMQIKSIWTVLLSDFEMELVSPAPAPDYGSWVTGPKAPCRVRYRRRARPLRPAP